MASIRTKHLPLPAIQVLLLVAPFLLHVGLAQNCATAGCQTGYCCSKYGYCGTTDDYCGANCESQCPSSPSPPSPPSGGPPSSGSGVGSIVTSSVFDSIFPSRASFYTYDSFISATGSFGTFGTTGSSDVQKREIAAFFAHVYHETGGLTKINEDNPPPDYYCDPSKTQYPCASGKQYYGRGPLQISWNYNYGQAGDAESIGQDLLANPDLVAQDPTISFKTALWFWTTPQAPKPSAHDVIDGSWTPSAADTAAGRTAGFGETINIINGGLECGPASNGAAQAQDRVTQFQSICSKLGVGPGPNLDCTSMQPY